MRKVPVVSVENASAVPKKPVALAIGFSARALAQALSDIGFRVITVDAFGDCDTVENSLHSHILKDWGSPKAELPLQPHLWTIQSQHEKIDLQADSIIVLLGGGCENWFALLDSLHADQSMVVLGPSPNQTRQLRSLALWQQAASHSGLRFPTTVDVQELAGSRHDAMAFEHGVSWLVKALNSSGGLSVRRIDSSALLGDFISSAAKNVRYPVRSSQLVLQQEIKGRVLGVVCVVDWNKTGTSPENSAFVHSPNPRSLPHVSYLGATEAWRSEDWFGPTEFVYRGSWGPIPLTELQKDQVIQAVRFLAQQTGIKGWLQMDFIEDTKGQLWMLEVNPRWSAGMEVLHRSGLVNPAAEHSKAWGICSGKVGQSGDSAKIKQSYIGKAVVYCHHSFTATAEFIRRLQLLPRDVFADIPSAANIGQVFQSGQPLLTVLACIPDAASTQTARDHLLCNLRESAEELWFPESH